MEVKTWKTLGVCFLLKTKCKDFRFKMKPILWIPHLPVITIGHFQARASVSKQVYVWNLSYGNGFCKQFHFHANQSHFHKNSFADSLWNRGTRELRKLMAFSFSVVCFTITTAVHHIYNVQFQTISILPPQKGLEFPGGWWVL